MALPHPITIALTPEVPAPGVAAMALAAEKNGNVLTPVAVICLRTLRRFDIYPLSKVPPNGPGRDLTHP